MAKRAASTRLALATLPCLAGLAGSATAQTVTELFKEPTLGAIGAGIDVDAAGNVFFATGLANRLYKILPGGLFQIVLTVNGDGVHTFGGAVGVAVDSQGNAFVAGLLSSNVFRVTPGGAISQVLDASGDGSGNTCSQPWGVAVDGADHVVVACSGGAENVFRIAPGGAITRIVGPAGDGLGNTLGNPWRVAADAAGNAYVTGRTSDNAFRITPGGVVTEIIDFTGDGSHPLKWPDGIAVGPGGEVYVAGRESNNVFRIDPGGGVTQVMDASGDGLGNPLTYPRALAVDAAGNLFVGADESANVFRVTPAGAIREIIDREAGGAGIMAGANFLAIGAPGVFYVTGEFTKNAFEVVLPPPFDPLAVPSASRAGSAALITALLLAAWLVLPRRARPA